LETELLEFSGVPLDAGMQAASAVSRNAIDCCSTAPTGR